MPAVSPELRASGVPVPTQPPGTREQPSPSGHGGDGSGPRKRAVLPGPLRLPLRLGPADREVLWLYLWTRIGIWTTAYCVRWVFPPTGDSRDVKPVLAPFQQWDWYHYLHIAQQGYFPGQAGPWQSGWDNREAFFPGFPLVLRAVHVVVPSWAAAGLLVSFVAGAFAVLALARIARLYLPDPDAGTRTVLFLLLSPCAIFLAVGYTEALFLAFALPAWLAAQRRNWPLAAVLTALATSVRISGLFVAAAIALHFLLTTRTRKEWRSLPWLALPALSAGIYSWYLHAHTGDWMAWKHAEERGWYRDFHAPWDAWTTTWHSAFGHTQASGYAFMFQAELAAMVVGLLLVGLLAWRRRWAEALYIGLSLWALGTSYWYTSIPRATLLWWPLWIGLAGWSLRNPRVKTVYLSLAVPLMGAYSLAFLSGRWAG
ncbi:MULTISPECIES: mannosyltransferase family protein [unclassified Streptomyces]|uniref:mannosyltransferase family protein n=1 Tax=unclassified Streptomyces TaxID=2593676 RepID=UPI002252CFBF|nr:MULTISPECIES: mannosyltransferase family protein [unclassified Streptomyces]MCX4547360.1 mannosyltransferase family protein [Streptomyces sp. NBC_01500]WSC19083.1 mannosyltransferase family protein [Streptomyces sp. NBC_01766]WSV53106.1 mannosyltransferase family protein [Streptomyces sp. NBC_01014]